MTRVAFTTLAPFISGAERSLQTLLMHAPEANIEPLVVCPPGSPMVPWCHAHGVAVLACDLPLRDRWRPFRWWQAIRRLRSQFSARGVNLIHSNQLWSYPPPSAAAMELGLPRVCHLRDEVNSDALRWWCRSGAEAIVCISRYIQRQADAAWPHPGRRPRFEVLLNPVAKPERAGDREAAANAARARDAFGLRRDAVTFGFIGQLISRKGLLPLLEVLASLPSNAAWQLLVAGKDPTPGGGYLKECRQRVECLGMEDNVRFAGFLEDASLFYQAIDLAVVPSLEEPLGRVPLEAAVYAKPSVAFAVGGLPETIRHGETGWLVRLGDAGALAATLREYLTSPDPTTGVRAREWATQVSDPKRYVNALATIYDSLV